jgi:hypothetical protein
MRGRSDRTPASNGSRGQLPDFRELSTARADGPSEVPRTA